MTWEPWGNYAQRNGDYSICKVKSQGVWLCMLWRISTQERLGQGTYKEMVELYERTRGN